MNELLEVAVGARRIGSLEPIEKPEVEYVDYGNPLAGEESAGRLEGNTHGGRTSPPTTDHVSRRRR